MRRAPQDGQKPRHLHEKARARPGQMLVAATGNLHSHEAMLKTSAAQIVIELISHEARQLRIPRVQASQECWQVQCDHRIQCRLFGSVANGRGVDCRRAGKALCVHANNCNEVRQSGEGVSVVRRCRVDGLAEAVPIAMSLGDDGRMRPGTLPAGRYLSTSPIHRPSPIRASGW